MGTKTRGLPLSLLSSISGMSSAPIAVRFHSDSIYCTSTWKVSASISEVSACVFLCLGDLREGPHSQLGLRLQEDRASIASHRLTVYIGRPLCSPQCQLLLVGERIQEVIVRKTAGRHTCQQFFARPDLLPVWSIT